MSLLFIGINFMLIVKLKHNAPYTATLMNPKINSNWETTGLLHNISYINSDNDDIELREYINTINDIKRILEIINNDDEYNINIKWDNGTVNSYKSSDLLIKYDNNFISLDLVLNTYNNFRSIW